MIKQITIFDLDIGYMDEHTDRNGNISKPPKWMKYRRCENCVRWKMLDVRDQPPSGWGVYGFCMEHKCKCSTGNYCMNFEDKRKI